MVIAVAVAAVVVAVNVAIVRNRAVKVKSTMWLSKMSTRHLWP
jgi:hypothetical protein